MIGRHTQLLKRDLCDEILHVLVEMMCVISLCDYANGYDSVELLKG